jgi:hypothetical protein
MNSFPRSFAILAVLGSMVSGCTFNKLCVEGKFAGLKHGLEDARSENAVMRMLIVHGIGDHQPGYSSNFVTHLAHELDLERTYAGEIRLIEDGKTNGILILQSFNEPGGQTRLRVYELTWAPTTRQLKDSAFSFDVRLDNRRSLINRKLKRYLFNDGFGDAVLYLGEDVKRQMQNPITNAVRTILADGFTTNDMMLIVTHSLGSKMTLDSINAMARPDPGTEPGTPAKVQDLAMQTRYLIMFANQIPLLHLADPAQTNVVTLTETNISTQIPAVQQFVQTRGKVARRRPPKPERAELQIIAVTDPNDVLSYPLRASDVQSDSITRIEFGNVLIPNTGSFFKLLANPFVAHEGYFDNPKLRRLLINGYAGSPKPCVKPPKSSASTQKAVP